MTFFRWSPFALVAVMTISSTARASSPMGVYARVDSVEFEPSEPAAVRFKIFGVFALHKGPPSTGFDYSEPVSGHMYFACQPGQELECRQQWQELKGFIGKPLCAGFGQQLQPFGTVRRGPPTPPDPYDLGMGVVPAAQAGGICPRLLAFQRPPPDAGADGAAPPPPAPPGPPGPPPHRPPGPAAQASFSSAFGDRDHGRLRQQLLCNFVVAGAPWAGPGGGAPWPRRRGSSAKPAVLSSPRVSPDRPAPHRMPRGGERTKLP